MSYCQEYAGNVKRVVCELLDVVYERKFDTMTFDTDEDCPCVHIWTRGKAIKVYGWNRNGLDAIYPTDEGENWSFLECCQRALRAARELTSAATSESKEGAE